MRVAEVDVEADHLAGLRVGRGEGRHVGEGAAAQLLALLDVLPLVGLGRRTASAKAMAAAARPSVRDFDDMADLLGVD